jgi:predicted unusual protein kinase regulating ubiquinone biosynthesis (AarF/ABC1/UbiB family)
VHRAVRDGLKRRAKAIENYEESLYVAVPEPSDSLAGRKPEKQFLYPRHRDPKEMDAFAGPPMITEKAIKPKKRKTLVRLILYMQAAVLWYMTILRDKLIRQNTVERRAKHLREIIERLGGTAVKIGQQAGLRMDLLPQAYGDELKRMLDEVPAFPTEYAIKRIEAVTGKPLDETFAEFDHVPIGSGSVACVYKAVLLTGETVAVKVRRKNIAETFVSDCQALNWVFRILEHLTVLRDGLTKNLISALQTILLEESDFVKEARHTELFRRRAHKKLHRVSAPKIFFDHSGDDVIVQEFVTGVPMGDLIAYVESKDEEALARLRRLNIDPVTVAKKLIRVNQFGVFESLLFHADPHPSNVVVQPNNKLVFIDFGAVGAYTTMERNNWRQLNYYHHRRDVGRMAQTALAILEPLPAVDVDDFRQRLEQVFWQDIYAFESKHSAWYERTSVNIWRSLFKLTREFNVPMNLNTLRMIRSTLLSETVAARLYPRVSAWREHRKYNQSAAKRARKRVLRGIRKRLCGPTNTDYQRIEQLKGLFNRTVYLYQRFLDNPLYRYGLLIKKAIYAIALIVRTVFNFLMLAVGALIVAIAIDIYDTVFRKGAKNLSGYMAEPFITRNALNMFYTFNWTTRVFWLLVLIGTFLNMRRMLRRFFDKDIRPRNTSGLS